MRGGRGVGRVPPPLRHAEDLKVRKHPLADEVLALTSIYLDARFGGQSLDEPARKDFERRIRAIRTYKKPPAGSPSPQPAT